MMKDFSDFFTDPNYAQSYARSEQCAGIVYIESEHDIEFWQGVFEQSTQQKYTFKVGTSDQPHVRSKTLFNDMYDSANAKALIAIDSDFDYLANNRSDIAEVINNNPYVLQTFVYAVENLNLEVNTLDDCVAKTRFFVRHEYTVSAFLLQYSAVIYPLLMRYLYLMNYRVAGTPDESDFHRVITSFDLNQLYFDNNWDDFCAHIDIMQVELNQMAAADDFDGFEQRVRQKGMSSDNSYQFINGHVLEERIVQPLMLNILNQIKAQELARIKASFATNEINKRKKEMDKHFDKRCAFDTLVATCELKKHDPFYQKVCTHLQFLAL